LKPLKKPELIEREELVLAGKKKPFAKKRRVIEERMFTVGETEEEEPVEKVKEGEVGPRPYRAMKKKVVLAKTPKKTEVTVPKPSRGSSGLQKSSPSGIWRNGWG